MSTFTTTSAKETQKIAEDFATTLEGGEVLCLWGDMGHGKTTFTQGLAKGLGIEGRVNSPTFIIMRTYELKNKENKLKMLYHIDLYRVSSEKEIEELGVLDLIHKPENIVIIEWPEKMGTVLPKNKIDIKFDYIEENKRRIIINS